MLASLHLQIQLCYPPLNLIKPIIKVARLLKGRSTVNHRRTLPLAKELTEVQLEAIYLRHLFLVEPLSTLSVLPQAILDLFIFGDRVFSQAVLFSLEPVTFVAATVRPGVNSEAVLLIVLVLTLVPAAIIPDVDAHAFHIVIEPLAFVAAAIEPRVDADAGNLVFPPVSCISTLVVPLIRSNPVFPPKRVFTLVPTLVSPGFSSTPML